MTKVKYDGGEYPLLAMERLTPGEAAELERATGLTVAKIRHLCGRCVCEHPAAKHDEEETACEESGCWCEEFSADAPTSINTALLYLSVKRAVRSVKYSEIEAIPYLDLLSDDDDEGDEPDPS